MATSKRMKELIENRADLYNKLQAIVNKAETEQRGMSADEISEHSNLLNDFNAVNDEVNALKTQSELDEMFKNGNVKGITGEDAKQYQSEAAKYNLTADIFRTIMNEGLSSKEKADKINDLQTKLFAGGHYTHFENAVDAYNTILDKDGAVFLPTSIAQQIFEISKESGVFPAASLNLTLPAGGGKLVFPNLLGNFKFYAVNQGNKAKASRALFSGLSIEDKKWMTYVPWTYEMGQLNGQELVGIIIRKLGEARSETIDDTVINADGTSAYHSKVGIVARAADANYPEVGFSTAAATRTSFGAIKEDDLLAAQLNVAPAVRDGGIYVFHSDWKIRLKNLKDGEGRPLYLSGGAISIINGEYFVHGNPARFSELVPNEDGNNKVYGLFLNPRYVALGSVAGVTAERFNTGSIPAEDGGDDINLLAGDMEALRAKVSFDFELSQVLSNDKGAFTVLRTANA